jgi:hypothetical protein
MEMKMLRAGLVLFLSCAPNLAQATWFLETRACQHPFTPMCVGRFETYEEEDRHFNCEKEMVEYAREVDLYLSCLHSKQDSAEKMRKKVLQDWKCRSRTIKQSAGVDADCKR